MTNSATGTPTVDINGLAEHLRTALATATTVPPLTDELPNLTVGDAYAIQQVNLDHDLREGATLVGRKIGITSAPMQELLGVDQPDFGYILDTMVVDDAGSIPTATLCAPRAEPEIAFRLASALRGPGITVDDVLAATDAVATALEIVDSRIADWKITLPDTVADNASSGLVVLGPWVDVVSAGPLDEVTATLVVNGETVDTGTGAAVLGHPAAAVAWLANALADYGTGIEAGQFIMSGSITTAVFVHAGDTASAHLDGLGDVSVSFL